MRRSGVTAACVVLVVLATALVTASGCRKPMRRVLTKDQQRIIQEAIVDEVPASARRIGAVFDGKVELVAIEITPTEVAVGKRFDVVYYWRSLAPAPGDWKVFGHLEQGSKRQILDHHPVRDLYPIQNWKKGQIIRDAQQVVLEKGFRAGNAVLWVGIFDERAWREQRANVRMAIRKDAGVQTDGHRRVKVATLRITAAARKGAAAAPRHTVRWVEQAPVLDGKLDDPAWKQATPLRPLVQPDGRPLSSALRTRVWVVRDATKLYVAFDVTDADVVNTLEGRDATLWQQDVVEVYLDPGADGKDYVEIQVSPTGAIFDAVFARHRTPPWKEAARRNLPIEAAVHVDGTVNQSGDRDRGWKVELAIPLAALPGVAEGGPKPGTQWTANFYRIDGAAPRQVDHQGAWAAAGGDFHDLSRAGKLVFGPAPQGRPASAAPNDRKEDHR